MVRLVSPQSTGGQQTLPVLREGEKKMNARIQIDYDKKCAKCGRAGACPNGWCLGCNSKKVDALLAQKLPKNPLTAPAGVLD